MFRIISSTYSNRNNGAKFASGDWLFFTDDDCLPSSNILKTYLDHVFLHPSVSVFEGCTIADRDKQRYDEEAPLNTTGGVLWSCNFLIKSSLFIKLQGFDESFPFASMEDVDFHKRVRSLSEILFVSDAVIIHPWRRIKPFNSFKKHLKSQAHFYRKYPDLKNSSFRIERLKIFIGTIFFEFFVLISYKMKGWLYFLEKCFLNFLLIFI